MSFDRGLRAERTRTVGWGRKRWGTSAAPNSRSERVRRGLPEEDPDGCGPFAKFWIDDPTAVWVQHWRQRQAMRRRRVTAAWWKAGRRFVGLRLAGLSRVGWARLRWKTAVCGPRRRRDVLRWE